MSGLTSPRCFRLIRLRPEYKRATRRFSRNLKRLYAMDYPEEKPLTATGELHILNPAWGVRSGNEAQGRDNKLRAYSGRAALCLALHVLLILFHIAILIVRSGHYEHHTSFAVTSVALEWYPLIATTIMQVIGTVSHSCTRSWAVGAHASPDLPRHPRRLHPGFGIPERALCSSDADRPARQEQRLVGSRCGAQISMGSSQTTCDRSRPRVRNRLPLGRVDSPYHHTHNGEYRPLQHDGPDGVPNSPCQCHIQCQVSNAAVAASRADPQPAVTAPRTISSQSMTRSLCSGFKTTWYTTSSPLSPPQTGRQWSMHLSTV